MSALLGRKEKMHVQLGCEIPKFLRVFSLVDEWTRSRIESKTVFAYFLWTCCMCWREELTHARAQGETLYGACPLVQLHSIQKGDTLWKLK